MRLARGLMIVAYGLVAIAAETLLFREFITAFEGNDISVGVFFGSWFLWVGLGAVLVRRWGRFAETLLRHIEPLFLLYIPAFLVQLLLILHVRDLAGLAAYDLVSVPTLLLWAMVVNAPVSLVTGLLFPVACRWIEQTNAFPVSRIYLLEAIGSFAGGLVVTALLAWHVPMVKISLLLTLVLSASVSVTCLSSMISTPRGKRRLVTPLATAVFALAMLLTGADQVFVRTLQRAKWSRLLPRETLHGVFHTAQAEYLYGRYGGQWIAMREGGVCEALPGEEEAGRTAAMVLCQNPQARRILVIGSGMALCGRLLMVPPIELVAWAHPDPEYAKRLLERIPREFALDDGRFHPVTDEIREYLSEAKGTFDLVVLSLPDVTSSAANRYYTVEFYERIKASLRVGGVVAVGIAGGEDVMGAELVALGASTRRTLAKVFASQVLVPGEQAWLIASDSKGLTDDPAAARDRFAAIAGSQRVFPTAGLLSVYLPDRAAQAMLAYDRADLPEELLINRDSRPLAHLYGLLLAARQSGASVTYFVRLLALGGWLPFVVPMLVLVALRTWTIAERRPGADPSDFDSALLVLSTGWVGIAMVILLMYLYETRFGSLYLHIGLISSLFMAGLTAGALFVSRLVARASCRRSLHILLLGILLTHAAVLAVLALWSGEERPYVQSGHALFALVFVLSGLCCGGYWPVAAAQLAGASLHSGEAGSRLETADHLGACLGGLVTSLLMVPVLGTKVSLLVLIGLVLVNLPAAVAGLRERQAAETRAKTPPLKHAGYALLGLCACIVLCSNILARAQERSQPTLPPHAVSTLAGEQQTRLASAILGDGGRRINYVTLIDADQKPAGYVFSSADFAPEVRGFGGRFNLAIRADASGRLVDLLMVRSNETPSYLELLHGWLGSLKEKTLFAPEPLADVDAVAGATVSSEAVLAALRTSGRRFAAEVLNRGTGPDTDSDGLVARLPDTTALYLTASVLLAFIATHRGGSRSRIAVLVLTFAFGGIVLNAQYSSEQIATLLSFDAPRAELTGVFLLVVGVPVLVLLFGNLYCGYLCPFGAAQELLGYLLPRRLRPAPTRGQMRAARFVKYVVLAILIAGFFIARDRRTLGADPLTSVFALHLARSPRSTWAIGIIAAALAGSLFYGRFWCRYLCPAGAFLSLLNRARLFRRLIPAPWFSRCEFGLTASDHLDCLYCDRCRHGQESQISNLKSQIGSRTPLVLVTVLAGLLVSGLTLSEFRLTMPQVLHEPATAVGAGRPRDVDARQIRTLIDQGRLSNREAEHYRQVE